MRKAPIPTGRTQIILCETHCLLRSAHDAELSRQCEYVVSASARRNDNKTGSVRLSRQIGSTLQVIAAKPFVRKHRAKPRHQTRALVQAIRLFKKRRLPFSMNLPTARMRSINTCHAKGVNHTGESHANVERHRRSSGIFAQ